MIMTSIRNCRVSGIKCSIQEGDYMETTGNTREKAIQKYIQDQAEESRKEDSKSTAL